MSDRLLCNEQSRIRLGPVGPQKNSLAALWAGEVMGSKGVNGHKDEIETAVDLTSITTVAADSRLASKETMFPFKVVMGMRSRRACLRSHQGLPEPLYCWGFGWEYCKRFFVVFLVRGEGESCIWRERREVWGR